MKLHMFEKLTLIIGASLLILFLVLLGVQSFILNNHHSSSSTKTINPNNVDETKPFDQPGLVKVDGKDWDYELVIVASAFTFVPNEVEIPKNAKVKIIATTKDVIHGFEIPGTNINFTLQPGYISEHMVTFHHSKNYTIICNEYCGTGHHLMTSTIKVVER